MNGPRSAHWPRAGHTHYPGEQAISVTFYANETEYLNVANGNFRTIINTLAIDFDFEDAWCGNFAPVEFKAAIERTPAEWFVRGDHEDNTGRVAVFSQGITLERAEYYRMQLLAACNAAIAAGTPIHYH